MKVLFMCGRPTAAAAYCPKRCSTTLAPEGFEAISSGSFPKGQVLPRSLSTPQAAGISTEGLYSKGNEAFEGSPPDVVITVRTSGRRSVPGVFRPVCEGALGVGRPFGCAG